MNLFFVTPDGRCEGNIPSFSWIILLLRFLGIIIRKGFSKKAKITEISAFSENWFSGNKTQLIYKGHWMTSEAYFIEWTTSGKPPVCLKNPLCSYFRSNKHQLSEGSNLTPCMKPKCIRCIDNLSHHLVFFCYWMPSKELSTYILCSLLQATRPQLFVLCFRLQLSNSNSSRNLESIYEYLRLT